MYLDPIQTLEVIEIFQKNANDEECLSYVDHLLKGYRGDDDYIISIYDAVTLKDLRLVKKRLKQLAYTMPLINENISVRLQVQRIDYRNEKLLVSSSNGNNMWINLSEIKTR